MKYLLINIILDSFVLNIYSFLSVDVWIVDNRNSDSRFGFSLSLGSVQSRPNGSLKAFMGQREWQSRIVVYHEECTSQA